MRGMEHQAKLGSSLGKRAQQRHGIGPAGKGNGQPHSRLKKIHVEWEGCAHERMIAPAGMVSALLARGLRQKELNHDRAGLTLAAR